jgi:hypothetical protein
MTVDGVPQQGVQWRLTFAQLSAISTDAGRYDPHQPMRRLGPPLVGVMTKVEVSVRMTGDEA